MPPITKLADLLRGSLPTVSQPAMPSAPPYTPVDPSNLRPDGSRKGRGFLGVLQRPDGMVMSEYSVGVPIGGKEMDIPTLVPTLTHAEVDTLLHLKEGEAIPASIIRKAAHHAYQRLSKGQPVFATDGEQNTDLFPNLKRTTSWP